VEAAEGTLGAEASYDPHQEREKLEGVVEWSVREMGCSGPQDFLSLLNRVDLETKDQSGRYSLLDRMWLMVNEQRAKKAMWELARAR
jgi:hypothetical protein